MRTEFTGQAILIGVSDLGSGDRVGWAILIAIFGLIALDLFGNVRARLRSRLSKGGFAAKSPALHPLATMQIPSWTIGPMNDLNYAETRTRASAVSGNVCALDQLAEGFVVSIAVAPGDVAADQEAWASWLSWSVPSRVK